MSPERKYGVVIAPSAGLAWDWAMSPLGAAATAAGAGAGGFVGFVGGWVFGWMVGRAERAEHKWRHGLAAFGLLVVLWLGLVILPAVLSTGAWGVLPRPGKLPPTPQSGQGTPMGVVADFVSVPEDVWPTALSRLGAAGIEVRDEGTERGVAWYSCSRGACRVGLGYGPDGGREVTVYCPALRLWRRPLGMWRLYRDVRRALRAGS